VACIPTKALVKVAKLAHAGRRLDDFGVRGAVSDPLDMSEVLGRKRSVVREMVSRNQGYVGSEWDEAGACGAARCPARPVASSSELACSAGAARAVGGACPAGAGRASWLAEADAAS
jgi:hypothetical protein